MTRKRVKHSLERQLTDPCPYCSGTGTVKSSSTICYEILGELRKIASDVDGASLVLRVNPDIAQALKREELEVLKDAESVVGRKIVVKPDARLHHEQFDVMTT